MPLSISRFGDVLCHIFDIKFWGTIYFQDVEQFEVDTPCIVKTALSPEEEERDHLECLAQGFKYWLNVADVSDFCEVLLDDDVLEESRLVDCINAAWQDGRLKKALNYRRSDSEAEC